MFPQFSCKPSSRIYIAILFSIFSAVGFILAFPGGPFPHLAWVSMVPLILTLKITGSREAFLVWAVYGIVFWAGSTHWMHPYLQYVVGVNEYYTTITLLLMWAISSIPYMITGFIANRFNWIDSFFGGLKIGVLLTFLVSIVPVPFPGDLSLSQFRIPIMTQIADIGGGHFVLFFIIWVNILISQIIISRSIKHQIAAIILIFTLIISYGSYKLNFYKDLHEKAHKDDFVNIAYIQPNLPGADLSFLFGPYAKVEEEGAIGAFLEDANLALEKAPVKVDAVFWPELPQMLYFFEDNSLQDDFYKTAQKYEVPLFFVAMVDVKKDDLFQEYVTGESTLIQVTHPKKNEIVYKKANLIPFSEYIPGESYFPFLRRFFPRAGNIQPGDNLSPIKINDKLSVIPLICYDGIFPKFVRNFVKKDGNVLISMDNDTNFGPTKASEVHFAVMYYRCLENRIPLIRINNAGVSSTVLSSGEIPKDYETDRYKRDYRIASILPKQGDSETFYQYFGHHLPAFFFMIVLITSFFSKHFSLD